MVSVRGLYTLTDAICVRKVLVHSGFFSSKGSTIIKSRKFGDYRIYVHLVSTPDHDNTLPQEEEIYKHDGLWLKQRTEETG